MSVNGLTDEQLGAFVRQQLARTSISEMATSPTEIPLPTQILEDLETTDPATALTNLNSYIKSAPRFEGGKWTRSGQINQIFHQEIRNYRLDALTVIKQRYKDGDRLRIAGQSAAEAFSELSRILERGGDEEHDATDLEQLLERIRRLAVFAFSSGKTIDQEARSISNKALGIQGPDMDAAQKDMAYSAEEVTAWEEKKFQRSLLRNSVQSRTHPFRGRGNFGNRGCGGRSKFFFGNRGNGRHRPNQGNPPQDQQPRD